MYQFMKNYIVFLFLIFFSSYQGFTFSISSADSLGVTTKGGSNYIIHEVEAGETLYELSRKYGIDVQSIKNANTESVGSLNVGQKVLIPFHKKPLDEEGKLHTVKSSETLFSISRQYNVKVDDLKNWNNLGGNSISVGQQLVIKGGTTKISAEVPHVQEPANGRNTHTVEQSQTLYSISRMYGVSADQLKEWNKLESNTLDIGQVLIVSSSVSQAESTSNSSMLPPVEDNDKQEVKTEIPKEAVTTEVAVIAAAGMDESSNDELDIIEEPVDKIVEKGFAEVIENTAETKKYLALHREAPVGTIMQVRNEMNKQSVFVRIVGRIPPTGDNSKVILKISKKAYDRLGAVDSRFPVEISYIP